MATKRGIVQTEAITALLRHTGLSHDEIHLVVFKLDKLDFAICGHDEVPMPKESTSELYCDIRDAYQRARNGEKG